MKNVESVLQEMVKKHKKLVEESEKELIKYALEHNVSLYLGEYGIDGRSLILNDGTLGDGDDYWVESVTKMYGGPGKWLYSSLMC